MPVSPSAIQLHFDYSAWATNRLLDAASRLATTELNRDFATADRSVIGTLVHLYHADRIWLARVEGRPNDQFDDSDYDLALLTQRWNALQRQWRDWAAQLTEASVNETRSYRDLKGNPWTTPLWQIALHVVNHGTHHRGQAAGFIRSMGHTPPPLDLIAYYRSLG